MFDTEKQQALRQELDQLHRLLAEVAEADVDTTSALKKVAEEIHQLLGDEDADGRDTSHEWSHLGQRWNQVRDAFESRHPRLTEVISKITTLLANAGI